MPVRKLSIALDAEVAEGVAGAASAAGISVSAWLNRAAEDALAIQAGLAAAREWQDEHGAFSDAERAAADRTLDRLIGKAAPRAS